MDNVAEQAKEGLTHDDLAHRAEKWLKNTCCCGVVFNDNFRPNTPNDECPCSTPFIDLVHPAATFKQGSTQG